MTSFFPPFSTCQRPPASELLLPTEEGESERLQSLLATTEPSQLTAEQAHDVVSGNIWMLTPAAFRYFLPAFMTLSVNHFDSLIDFTLELIAALTEPTRDDIVKSLDLAAEIPVEMGLPPETLQQLRQDQLEWFDSGQPLTAFLERVASLSADERAAIKSFLEAMRDAHRDEFPLNEPDAALERYWARPL